MSTVVYMRFLLQLGTLSQIISGIPTLFPSQLVSPCYPYITLGTLSQVFLQFSSNNSILPLVPLLLMHLAPLLSLWNPLTYFCIRFLDYTLSFWWAYFHTAY